MYNTYYDIIRSSRSSNLNTTRYIVRLNNVFSSAKAAKSFGMSYSLNRDSRRVIAALFHRLYVIQYFTEWISTHI